MKKYLFPAFLALILLAAAANAAFNVGYVPLAHAQTQTQTTAPLCLALATNLSVGSQNASVTKLQDFLRLLGYLNSESTGYYGPMTMAAVKNFQSAVGLPVVGAVGPLTRLVIQKATCTQMVQPQVITPVQTPAPIATSSASTTPTIIVTIATTTAPSLPYSAQTFNDWQTAWGTVSTTSSGALRLQGSLDNNGAEAIYPNSMDWSDYRYQTNLSIVNGNISLIARYVDADNFLACSFAKNWVEIDQVHNGSTTLLISKSVDGILPGQQGIAQATSVAMDVQGNKVGCAGYGPADNVTYTLPAGSPLKGGIGIESWYETPLADQLDLMSVKVDPL